MTIAETPTRCLFFTGKGGVGKTSISSAVAITLSDKRRRVLLVTLPEAIPVHEAATLQCDLARAQVTPFAWVINQALTPVETADPVLLGRQANERAYIDEVTKGLAGRAALIPWLADQPTAATGLHAMLGDRGEAAAGGVAATVEQGMSPATDENIAVVVGRAQAAC